MLETLAQSWSNLGKIGNSAIGRATLLTPIIGTYILFNERISAYLQLSISGASPIQHGPISDLYTSNLLFLYFGLTGIGIGTFLFKILTPRPFSMKLEAAEYAQYSSGVRSDGALQLELRCLISAIHKNQSTSLESEIAEETMISLFRRVNFATPENRGILPDLGRSFVRKDSGGICAKSICREALTNSRLFRVLLSQATDNSQEIFFSSYLIQDQIRPVQRLILTCIFAASTFLTILPAILTTALIMGFQ